MAELGGDGAAGATGKGQYAVDGGGGGPMGVPGLPRETGVGRRSIKARAWAATGKSSFSLFIF